MEDKLAEHSMFKPLDKKRYFEQIARLIRERILHDNLEEGFKLPTEQQLAKELDVSRSVVREALRILDVMGYVDIRKGPQGGIFVSNHYHKPIRDSLRGLANDGHITVGNIFDVRFQIEPFIAGEAARHAKKRDLKKLFELIEDASLHMDDAVYLKQKDLEFHLLLAEASGNPVLAILMKSLIEILAEIAHDFLNSTFEKELFKIHKNILHTIAQRKVNEVRKLIKTDILFVKKNLKKFFKKEMNKS
jgi:GntR family transcriptional repressor for pyruvate dehydrogenase complex